MKQRNRAFIITLVAFKQDEVQIKKIHMADLKAPFSCANKVARRNETKSL